MAHRPNRACQVFVGNIPYDTREDELKDIMSIVGPVVSCRVMVDKASNRPKGYAFCEYRDFETAHSAMRNLNGREYGGRPLRIDWADHEMKTQEGLTKVLERNAENRDIGISSERAEKYVAERLQKDGRVSEDLLSLCGDNMWWHKEIQETCDNAALPQLQHLLGELKNLLQSDPQLARSLLDRYPQLRLFANMAMMRLTSVMEPFQLLRPEELAAASYRVCRENSLNFDLPNTSDLLGSVGTHAGGFIGQASHAYSSALGGPPVTRRAVHQGAPPPEPENMDPVKARAMAAVAEMSPEERKNVLSQLKELSEEQIRQLPEEYKQQLIVLMELEHGK